MQANGDINFGRILIFFFYAFLRLKNKEPLLKNWQYTAGCSRTKKIEYIFRTESRISDLTISSRAEYS